MMALFDLSAAFESVGMLSTETPRAYFSHTASIAPCIIGSNRISAVEDNQYVATPMRLLLPGSLVVFLKDR